jgi:thymidylate synthase
MTTTLAGESAGELFWRGVEVVIGSGSPVSPRGRKTREVLDVQLLLARPRARLVHLPPARVLNPAFAAAETVWILSGTDAPWIHLYTQQLRQYADDGVMKGAYGPRLRHWHGRVDQLAVVVELLRADPDSRRAVIQLYDPALDAAGHRDVPCTLGYRFHIRHGRLHMSTTMRSQDAWTGLPYDLFAATVLHELMAGWLGVEVGDYRHHVDSLHLYEQDIQHAELVLSAPAATEMPPLAVPWIGFDDLLSNVVNAAPTGHPGWDAISATMLSYRLWRKGDRSRALHLAAGVDGPLGQALDAWYRRLSARGASVTAAARSG